MLSRNEKPAPQRLGDAIETRFSRSARIYAANALWWFDTREGVQFGPFLSKGSAICALAIYVAQHVHEAGALQRQPETPAGHQDNISHLIEEVLEVLGQYRDYGEAAAGNWANSRLIELRKTDTPTAETIGRIRVLKFTLRHPQQTFDFEYFLKCRVG